MCVALTIKSAKTTVLSRHTNSYLLNLIFMWHLEMNGHRVYTFNLALGGCVNAQ